MSTVKPKHRWVLGYKNLYSISKNGVIYSHSRVCHAGRLRKGRFLSQGTTPDGYKLVTLSKDQTKTSYGVHRLVAKAWLHNQNNLPEVNHIDENKENNCVENLEWCTHQYNSAYSKAKTYTFTSPSGEQVTFTNMVKFCSENNLNRGSLHQVITGVYKQHKGWTYSKADCS